MILSGLRALGGRGFECFLFELMLSVGGLGVERFMYGFRLLVCNYSIHAVY